jgi:hypothetical protein
MSRQTCRKHATATSDRHGRTPVPSDEVLRETSPMADNGAHKREITGTEDEIELIANTLLRVPDLEGGTKTDLCRLLFRGVKGTVPKPGTVKPWLGWGTEKDRKTGRPVRRVSSPWKQSKKWAEFLIEQVDELLGDGSGEELGRLWRKLDRLHSEPRRPPSDPKGPRRRLLSGVDPHVTTKERRWRELSRLLDDADERFAEAKVPKRVEDLDLAVQFRMTSELTNFEIPAYVSRTSDGELRNRIAQALEAGPDQWQDRIVLASGPPKAGKTRSILEALRALVPHAYVLVKHPMDVSIGDLAEALIGAQTHEVFTDPSNDVPIVVLVEDAHLLLSREASPETRSRITNELRHLLHDERAGERPLILVGTIHDSVLAITDDSLTQAGISILDRNLLKERSVPFALGLDPSEELAAAETFSEQISGGTVDLAALHELAATMAAIDSIDQQVTDALTDRDRQFVNAALVHAAFDTAIIDPEGAKSSLLRTLTDRWHQELSPTRGRLSDAAFEDAMSWATTPVGSAWALVNPILGETPEDDRWRLLDAIAARRLSDPGLGWRKWPMMTSDSISHTSTRTSDSLMRHFGSGYPLQTSGTSMRCTTSGSSSRSKATPREPRGGIARQSAPDMSMQCSTSGSSQMSKATRRAPRSGIADRPRPGIQVRCSTSRSSSRSKATSRVPRSGGADRPRLRA